MNIARAVVIFVFGSSMLACGETTPPAATGGTGSSASPSIPPDASRKPAGEGWFCGNGSDEYGADCARELKTCETTNGGAGKCAPAKQPSAWCLTNKIDQAATSWWCYRSQASCANAVNARATNASITELSTCGEWK